jgi:hypothetical protein
MSRMRSNHPYPELYCDFNACMIERGYSVETIGSRRDIERLGLTLEQAVGKRFTFVQEDANENGERDDIMINGIIAKDESWGYLAIADPDGFYHRSEIVK